jgi:hypothetical protein
MAKYRQLMVQGETGWHLMSPTNAWEALRIAWMIWRYPDRVAALVGVSQEYMLENQVAAQRPSSFAGLTLTEVRVPFGMTVRFEGGALIVEAAQHLDAHPRPSASCTGF